MQLFHGIGALARRIEDLLGVWDERAAFFRQAHIAFCPVKQPHSELLLEIADLPAYRRLRYAVLARGICKIEHFAHSQKTFYLVEMHSCYLVC